MVAFRLSLRFGYKQAEAGRCAMEQWHHQGFKDGEREQGEKMEDGKLEKESVQYYSFPVTLLYIPSTNHAHIWCIPHRKFYCHCCQSAVLQCKEL